MVALGEFAGMGYAPSLLPDHQLAALSKLQLAQRRRPLGGAVSRRARG
jgi:hypothetical protein